MMFILIGISFINIFLYKIYFKETITEGNQNSEPKNDCNKQQVDIAMKQQETIDELEGKLQRFELLLKKQTEDMKTNKTTLDFNIQKTLKSKPYPTKTQTALLKKKKAEDKRQNQDGNKMSRMEVEKY